MSKNKYFDLSSNIFKQKALLLALWLTIALGFFLVRSILLPFLLATLLAYVFHPLVRAIGKIKIFSKSLPRAASVIIIYAALALLLVLSSTIFIPQFYRELSRLGREATILINSIDENTINDLGLQIEIFFRYYNLPLEIIAPVGEQHRPHLPTDKSNWISIDLLTMARDLLASFIFYIKSETKTIFLSANNLVTTTVSSIFTALLVFMITGFLLIDTNRIINFIYAMIPVKNQPSFTRFLERLDTRLSGVIRGQLIICLINAIMTLIGLLIFKIKFAFTLATIAGIFSIVPIFGSILSTIPIVLVALTMSPFKAFTALCWIAFIHLLEANLLNPKIMGDSAKIHPILIILALLAGEHFYGIFGALLAVPLISVIITIFSSMLNRAKVLDEAFANQEGNDSMAAKRGV